MKVLGIAFSARKEGNCVKCLKHCLDKFREYGFKTEILNAFELEIRSCSHCNYECFADRKCPIEDNVPEIYKKCEDADILIFAVPTYGGHLSSIYFAFAERGEAIFKSYHEFIEKLAKKVNFIVIGNLSAGGDMALHEVLYNFANLDFWPETLLFPAREYGRKSIKGDLIEETEVKKRIDRFVEMILKNVEKQKSALSKNINE
ncbi:MAG: flavodoxin family protein [Candidatus Methanofastidiosia archaeon]